MYISGVLLPNINVLKELQKKNYGFDELFTCLLSYDVKPEIEMFKGSLITCEETNVILGIVKDVCIDEEKNIRMVGFITSEKFDEKIHQHLSICYNIDINVEHPYTIIKKSSSVQLISDDHVVFEDWCRFKIEKKPDLFHREISKINL